MPGKRRTNWRRRMKANLDMIVCTLCATASKAILQMPPTGTGEPASRLSPEALMPKPNRYWATRGLEPSFSEAADWAVVAVYSAEVLD
jgi:hypothetical protein